jgi:hypothetical protein
LGLLEFGQSAICKNQALAKTIGVVVNRERRDALIAFQNGVTPILTIQWVEYIERGSSFHSSYP